MLNPISKTSCQIFPGFDSNSNYPPERLPVDEIAAYLGIKRNTVYKWISEKQMSAHQMGRFWKFKKSQVNTWVESGGAAESGPGGGKTMSYNEQETRFFLIDPVLRDKGYNDHQWIKMETPAPVEPTGPKGRRRKGSGRTDYLLCLQVGDMPKALPVGVLEAKKETEDPLKGMQQAKGYADC